MIKDLTKGDLFKNKRKSLINPRFINLSTPDDYNKYDNYNALVLTGTKEDRQVKRKSYEEELIDQGKGETCIRCEKRFTRRPWLFERFWSGFMCPECEKHSKLKSKYQIKNLPEDEPLSSYYKLIEFNKVQDRTRRILDLINRSY